MKLPNRYGYQPRSQREVDELDAEAEYWRNYPKKGGNCVLVLAGLIITVSSIVSALLA